MISPESLPLPTRKYASSALLEAQREVGLDAAPIALALAAGASLRALKVAPGTTREDRNEVRAQFRAILEAAFFVVGQDME